MRVVRVVPLRDGRPNGILACVAESTSALAEVYAVTVALPRSSSLLRSDSFPGADVVSLPRLERRRWAALVRGAEVVVIEAAWNRYAFLAARACRSAGVPYVVTPHGGYSVMAWRGSRIRRWKKRAYWWGVERWIVRHASGLWWSSDLERDLSRRPGLDGPREAVVAFPVRDLGGAAAVPSATTGGTSTDRAAVAAGGLHVVTVCLLRPLKHLEILLEAVALLIREGRPIRLTIAGSGASSYARDIRNLCDGLGLAEHVQWLGSISGEEVGELLAGADVYCCPGVESFGVAVGEALSAGLPVILSDQVGIAASVTSHGAGTVVPLGDVVALADALRSVRARERGAANPSRSLYEKSLTRGVFREAFTGAFVADLSVRSRQLQ